MTITQQPVHVSTQSSHEMKRLSSDYIAKFIVSLYVLSFILHSKLKAMM